MRGQERAFQICLFDLDLIFTRCGISNLGYFSRYVLMLMLHAHAHASSCACPGTDLDYADTNDKICTSELQIQRTPI
jgi:hypothetical protein